MFLSWKTNLEPIESVKAYKSAVTKTSIDIRIHQHNMNFNVETMKWGTSTMGSSLKIQVVLYMLLPLDQTLPFPKQNNNIKRTQVGN